MRLLMTYPEGTELSDQPNQTLFAIGVDRQRSPVAATATIRDPLPLREALLALSRTVWKEQRASTTRVTTIARDWEGAPDPIVTVQRDQITFEVFAGDGGAYGMVALPASMLESYTIMRGGTTTAELAWGLGETLAGWRSSAPARVIIGDIARPAEIPLSQPSTRDLEIPESWLRTVLQTQVSLLRRPYVFDVHPGDLLTLISYLDEHSAYSSPRGMRYEFQPGKPLQAVLEPWNQAITFHHTRYTGYPRTVRLWGRRRLFGLASLLPLADRVSIAIYGRGLPHVYTCHMGPLRFVLAITGWSGNDDGVGSGLDLTSHLGAQDLARRDALGHWLRANECGSRETLAQALRMDLADLEPALYLLVRSGQAFYDIGAQVARARDLFPDPIDDGQLFPADQRGTQARALADAGAVSGLRQSEGRSRAQDIVLTGEVREADAQHAIECALDESGRMTFGRCDCPFFAANYLARGPCVHLLAARLAFEAGGAERAEAADGDLAARDPVSEATIDEIPF